MRLSVLEIRHQVMDVKTVLLERATGREEDVPDDFVDFDATSDIAAFSRLRLDLLSPVLGDTL